MAVSPVSVNAAYQAAQRVAAASESSAVPAVGGIAPRTGFRPEEARGEGGTPSAKVSIEQEMIKLSDTQVHYQTATNLYQKAVNMFRTALGGR